MVVFTTVLVCVFLVHRVCNPHYAYFFGDVIAIAGITAGTYLWN